MRGLLRTLGDNGFGFREFGDFFLAYSAFRVHVFGIGLGPLWDWRLEFKDGDGIPAAFWVLDQLWMRMVLHNRCYGMDEICRRG